MAYTTGLHLLVVIETSLYPIRVSDYRRSWSRDSATVVSSGSSPLDWQLSLGHRHLALPLHTPYLYTHSNSIPTFHTHIHAPYHTHSTSVHMPYLCTHPPPLYIHSTLYTTPSLYTHFISVHTPFLYTHCISVHTLHLCTHVPSLYRQPSL